MSRTLNNIKIMKIDFFKKISEKDNIDYMKDMISYFISPIITGIKPASTVSLGGTKDIYNIWKEHGEGFLNELNLEFIFLKDDGESAIVLIYDRMLLERHLKIEKNKRFLSSLGYDSKVQVDRCLNYLKTKFAQIEFPNESGVFLGIPIEEVLGFINKEECILSGYFKVYNNSDRAEEVFKLYENSRRAVIFNVLRENKIDTTMRKIKNIYINKLDTVVNC